MGWFISNFETSQNSIINPRGIFNQTMLGLEGCGGEFLLQHLLRPTEKPGFFERWLGTTLPQVFLQIDLCRYRVEPTLLTMSPGQQKLEFMIQNRTLLESSNGFVVFYHANSVASFRAASRITRLLISLKQTDRFPLVICELSGACVTPVLDAARNSKVSTSAIMSPSEPRSMLGLSDLTHVVANRAVPRVRIQLDQDGLSYTEFYHLENIRVVTLTLAKKLAAQLGFPLKFLSLADPFVHEPAADSFSRSLPPSMRSSIDVDTQLSTSPELPLAESVNLNNVQTEAGVGDLQLYKMCRLDAQSVDVSALLRKGLKALLECIVYEVASQEKLERLLRRRRLIDSGEFTRFGDWFSPSESVWTRPHNIIEHDNVEKSDVKTKELQEPNESNIVEDLPSDKPNDSDPVQKDSVTTKNRSKRQGMDELEPVSCRFVLLNLTMLLLLLAGFVLLWHYRAGPTGSLPWRRHARQQSPPYSHVAALFARHQSFGGWAQSSAAETLQWLGSGLCHYVAQEIKPNVDSDVTGISGPNWWLRWIHYGWCRVTRRLEILRWLDQQCQAHV